MGERETPPKRAREEAEGTAADAKRHQQERPPYHSFLISSLLDEEGMVSGGDGGEDGEISSLMTALRQELSPGPDAAPPSSSPLPPADLLSAGAEPVEEGPSCDAEGVMRRLLEASDDDLGIPPSSGGEGAAAEKRTECSAGEEDSGGGLWLEGLETDAMAVGCCGYDYYALLQQGLFL